jgi:ATP synthase F1 delta subunit
LQHTPYVNATVDKLFEAQKKAGGDLYIPATVGEQFEKALLFVPNFTSVLTHPAVSPERRNKFIKEFATHFKASPCTVDMLIDVAEKNNWVALPEIVSTYKKRATAEKKEAIATVTSANPLTKEEIAAIEKNLVKHVPKGFKLVIETSVQPSLIGGLTISLGNMRQDLSISTAMARLDQDLDKAMAL